MLAALDPDDVIAAIASAPGAGLRGLVRVSGPGAWRVALSGFTADQAGPLPKRPEVRAGFYTLAELRPPLPASVALWPAPRTYTGQELAEIHAPAAPPLLSRLLAHCLAGGARRAEPGEFTLRAFLSGRIDLTRAEAVLSVIDARNPGRLAAALEQLAGGIAAPIEALRDRLLDLLAHLEANLDFVDEADVDPLARSALAAELDRAAEDLGVLARRLEGRDRASEHPRVVLAGPPNAGKSRLFNALLGDDHAIVSPVAGTTRDYLTAVCDCDGLAVELIDTAGAEAPSNPIAAQAQTHRASAIDRADLVLACSPESLPPEGDARFLKVWTKADLAPAPAGWLATSARTGEGIESLRRAIAAAIRRGEREDGPPTTTAARCRDGLTRAAAALRDAAAALLVDAGDELIALDLRLALDELGKITGVVVTDDVLDRIFRRFCIGK